MTLQKIETNRPLENVNLNALEALVNVVFDKLPASCPSIKTWSESDIATAKTQWVLGFAENGISRPEQVQAGMQALRAKTDDFVPSVGKFISWCRGNEYHAYGLPEPSEVLGRLEAFKDRDFKPIDYRSNAEYWLLSAIARKQKANIWIKTDELQKWAESELNTMLTKLKQGVQYGKPETKELPKTVSRKMNDAQREQAWRTIWRSLGVRK